MTEFEKIVNRETLTSFGIDLSVWKDEHQKLLEEGMILAWKENPSWTEDEAKAECRKQVTSILLGWFTEHYTHAVEETDYWLSLNAAFEDFLSMPLVKFLEVLEEQREYSRFCQEFYDDLRDMYNICSAGMWDEYQRMKKNKWRFSQYRSWLNSEIRRVRSR
jgi:hypothetical protein